MIRVYLRYPTGHEGYVGDLHYDGKKFTELTDRETMRERSRLIAADPKGIREWNEYRAATSPIQRFTPTGSITRTCVDSV